MYLYRLDWVIVEGDGGKIKDADRVGVTDLGRAVLAALDEGSAEQSDVGYQGAIQSQLLLQLTRRA
jgi:hypothetical protein